MMGFMKLDLLKKFQSSFTHRLSLSSRQPTLLKTPHPRPTLSSPVNVHVLRPSPTPPSKQQSLLFELHRAGGDDVHVRWAEHNARVEIHHAATDEALLLCPPVIRQLRMTRPPSYTHLIVLMRLAVGWLLLGCSEISQIHYDEIGWPPALFHESIIAYRITSWPSQFE
nr:uncharacterized protein LOC109765370 isoform X2 [Aegilops tauschii subsp. strangulata]